MREVFVTFKTLKLWQLIFFFATKQAEHFKCAGGILCRWESADGLDSNRGWLYGSATEEATGNF